MKLLISIKMVLMCLNNNVHFRIVETETEIKLLYNNQQEIYKKNAILAPEVFFESDSLIIITSNYNWDKSIKLQAFDLFYKDKNTYNISVKRFSNINFEKNERSNFIILKKDNVFSLYDKSYLINQTDSISVCEDWILSNLIKR